MVTPAGLEPASPSRNRDLLKLRCAMFLGGKRESNPVLESHNLPCYHYTTYHIKWRPRQGSHLQPLRLGSRFYVKLLSQCGCGGGNRTLSFWHMKPAFYHSTTPLGLQNSITSFLPSCSLIFF